MVGDQASKVLSNWHLIAGNSAMNIYKGYRFPADIIGYAVWVYYRFNLSYRDVEDLLAERGVNVSYESIRLWCNKFGPKYAKRLKRKHRGCGDTFYIDEGIVNLSNLRDKNRFSFIYTKFWPQLTLVHSLNARSRSVL